MIRPAVTLARSIHVASAVWVLILGFAIIADVLGRTLLNAPIQGTTEIIKASVVGITFLQLPLAIFSGSMLRTEVFADALGPTGRRLLRTVGYLLGAALFAFIVYASVNEAVLSITTGEYEGEGALRVPTWPVRWTIVLASGFSCLAYLSMIWLDWTGRLEQEIAFPGILQYDAARAGVIDAKGR